MDKLWKQIERKVAAYLGGVRVPITGRMRGSAPDVEHPSLSIEVKHRKEVPGWLLDAMNQAEASQKGDQIPVVIVHQKGQSIPESLTILRASSMLAMLAQISELESLVERLRDELYQEVHYNEHV